MDLEGGNEGGTRESPLNAFSAPRLLYKGLVANKIKRV